MSIAFPIAATTPTITRHLFTISARPRRRFLDQVVPFTKNLVQIVLFTKREIPTQVIEMRSFQKLARNCTSFYLGFHRPLRVVPPTAASPQPPPSYSARTPYFPSHFFPEKLHQYWQYYYPRIPGRKMKISFTRRFFQSFFVLRLLCRSLPQTAGGQQRLQHLYILIRPGQIQISR